MRKIVAGLLSIVMFWQSLPAHAQSGSQKTQAQLITETGTSFPDNTVGAITPFVLRQFVLDTVATLFAGNGLAPTTGPNTSVSGNAVCWGNAVASLLTDCGSTIRYRQTANTIYYVNWDTVATHACGPTGAQTCQPGSLSVTALQATNIATPFATLAQACAAVTTQVDANGFIPQINLSHGSPATAYGGAQCANGIPGNTGSYWITGDDTDNTQVVMTAPSGTFALYVTHYTIVRLRSVTVSDSGTSIFGLESDNFGGIDIQNVRFTAWTSAAPSVPIRIGQTGHLELVSPLGTDSNFIVGGAVNGWLRVDEGGNANFGQSNGGGFSTLFTINIAPGLSFPAGLINVPSGATLFNMSSGTFTGNSWTGPTAILAGPGFMQTNGAGCNGFTFHGSTPCQITPPFADDIQSPPTVLPNYLGGAVNTTPITVNFGVAGDNAILTPLPINYAQLRATGLLISQCTGSLAGMTFGINTATGGGGGAITPAGSTSNIVAAASPNTNGNYQFFNTFNNTNTETYTPSGGAIQLRVGATAAQSCKVVFQYQPVP